MKFWVYYSDVTRDGPEYGIEQFDTADQASAFVDRRMAETTRRDLRDYIVFQGVHLAVEVVEVVKKVRLVGEAPPVPPPAKETGRRR